MLPKKQKKNEKKKKSVPPIGMAGTNKKNKNKRSHQCQPVTCQEGDPFPPFETAGMRKTTKKKSQKNESGSFW